MEFAQHCSILPCEKKQGDGKVQLQRRVSELEYDFRRTGRREYHNFLESLIHSFRKYSVFLRMDKKEGYSLLQFFPP